MITDKTDSILYLFFKKEIHSFLKNRASIKSSHNSEDIHKLRVSIKKMKVLFCLYEMIAPKKTKAIRYVKIFKNTFKRAGQLREIEINRACISQISLPASEAMLYKQFLNSKEKKSKEKLDHVIAKFNSEKVVKIKNEIKKISENINKEELINYSNKFILNKINKIGKLSESPSNETMHKIRKNLKSIYVLSSLLYYIDSSKEHQKILVKLKKVEELIGSWHDQIVFEESLNAFIKSKIIKSGKELCILPKLLTEISTKNKKSIKGIVKKTKQTIATLK